MILTTVLLSACGQQQIAALDDRGSHYYGRDSATRLAAGFGPTRYQTAASIDTISSAPLAAPVAVAAAPIAAPAPAIQYNTASHHAASDGWAWPVQGTIAERFGAQGAGIANEGITIAATDGAPIRATAAGEVAYVGTDVRDYGNMVIVRHAGGELSSYAYAKEILVSKGDKVMQGDLLGYVGQSGRANSPQLHFAMREGNSAIDPLGKLPSQIASR